MADKEKRIIFEGILRTWVVGTSNYEVELTKGVDIVLQREPSNHYDENAIAVTTRKGECCGYIPRYDARYLGQLLDRKAIEITPEITGCDNSGKTPILLKIRVLKKGKFIFDAIKSNKITAIYHETILSVWHRSNKMTDLEIKEFRETFRPLVHDNIVSPITQFLYRVLKGVAEKRHFDMQVKLDMEAKRKETKEKVRREKLRVELTEAIGKIKLHGVIKCGAVKIIPLSWDMSQPKIISGEVAVKTGDVTFEYDFEREMMRVHNQGSKSVLLRRNMLINDGLEQRVVKESAIVEGGSEVEVKTTTNFECIDFEERPAICMRNEETTPPYKPYFEFKDVSLALYKQPDKFKRLEGCNGAAIFVGGIFESMEIFPNEALLQRAFNCERKFTSDKITYIGNKQMDKLVQRLIYRSEVSESRIAKGNLIKQKMRLEKLGCCGTALLGKKRCFYWQLDRDDECYID